MVESFSPKPEAKPRTTLSSERSGPLTFTKEAMIEQR
jgi:hypothetical protein